MDDYTCPSYKAIPNSSKLFGIVNEKGLIHYLKNPIEIDSFFLDEALKGRSPEKRFRFAGKCAKNGCKQWNKEGHECGLIDKVIEGQPPGAAQGYERHQISKEQEWNKFDTPEDTCQAPTREREYLRVRDVEFSDPEYSFRDLVNNPRPEPTYEETAEEFFETIKVIVTSEPGKDPKPDSGPDCKGC